MSEPTDSTESIIDIVRKHWAARLDAAAGKFEATPRQLEQYRAADAARALNQRLVATDAPIETLRAVADDVQTAARRLEGHRQGTTYDFGEVANAGGSGWAHFDHSPLLGQANPLAPPVRLRLADDVVEGSVTFTAAYEGPPGCVHGGFVAAMFDELLGAAQGLGGQPGMTGTLSIRYRSPTPLGVPLRLEGRLDRVEGRKTFVTGTCFAGDQVTAEAEGVFIAIDISVFQALREDRDDRLGQGSSDSPVP